MVGKVLWLDSNDELYNELIKSDLAKKYSFEKANTTTELKGLVDKSIDTIVFGVSTVLKEGGLIEDMDDVVDFVKDLRKNYQGKLLALDGSYLTDQILKSNFEEYIVGSMAYFDVKKEREKNQISVRGKLKRYFGSLDSKLDGLEKPKPKRKSAKKKPATKKASKKKPAKKSAKKPTKKSAKKKSKPESIDDSIPMQGPLSDKEDVPQKIKEPTLGPLLSEVDGLDDSPSETFDYSQQYNKRLVIGIGDLHGHYPALVELFDKLDKFYDIFEDRHNLILKQDIEINFTGDHIDRGKKSLSILSDLAILKRNNSNQVGLIFGNHELMALACLDHARYVSRVEDYAQYSYCMHGINGGKTLLMNLLLMEQTNLHLEIILQECVMVEMLVSL
ncbi:hypothetical protein HON01_09815 [Candidatus Woesearchaeota archaeon]|nr:hypothetical protein [Candidatus Woesearchaeota archaeon]